MKTKKVIIIIMAMMLILPSSIVLTTNAENTDEVLNESTKLSDINSESLLTKNDEPVLKQDYIADLENNDITNQEDSNLINNELSVEQIDIVAGGLNCNVLRTWLNLLMTMGLGNSTFYMVLFSYYSRNCLSLVAVDVSLSESASTETNLNNECLVCSLVK